MMRPWTAIVLSDYGRDRAAYQAYDALFDPALRAQSLPMANRYVLRIQAGFALMDWLAAQIGAVPGYPDNLWKDLAYPPSF
jgi:ATP-dependent helicase Lhr and Lhr-like helicase